MFQALINKLNAKNAQYKVTTNKYNKAQQTIILPLSNGKKREITFLFGKLKNIVDW